MSELHIAPSSEPEGSSTPRLLILAGAATVVIIGVILFWPRSIHRDAPASLSAHLSSGPAEQAYATELQVQNVQLSRSENFLHQEVTTVSGDLVNGGDRAVQDAELTLEFYDQMNQVVLRETRRMRPGAASPIPPGGSEPFEISVEHVSGMWNMQPPAIRVTGLLFANR
jgi:hypothetical protein